MCVLLNKFHSTIYLPSLFHNLCRGLFYDCYTAEQISILLHKTYYAVSTNQTFSCNFWQPKMSKTPTFYKLFYLDGEPRSRMG